MRESAKDLIKDIPVARSVMSDAGAYARRTTSHESRPAALYIAQFFLFLVIAIYFTKLSVLAMGFVMNYGDEFMAIVTFIVDVVMMLVTIDAIIGIASRKPASWRKVMRSAMLLFLFSVIGVAIGSSTAVSYVALDPAVVAVICIPMAALMFTRSVREYYVPPMQECPRLARWIGYAFIVQLFPAERYEIEY